MMGCVSWLQHSDSTADGFFPLEDHPVTMPAHDQKQKCSLADLVQHAFFVMFRCSAQDVDYTRRLIKDF